MIDKTESDSLIRKAQSGDKAAMNDIIRMYQPVITRSEGRYRNAPVPSGAIYGKALELTIGAINRYEPNTGTEFSTFLEHSLKGLYRYVNSNKGFIRIPEHRHLMLQKYEAVKSLLREQKGREPSTVELADAMAINISEVQAIQKSLANKEFAQSAEFERPGMADQLQQLEQTWDFMYYSLTDEERLVYDYALGKHGKTQLEDTRAIARKTGLTYDKVAAIKRSLADKLGKTK